MLPDLKYIDYIECHHLDYYTLAKFSLLDALQLNPSGKPVAGVNFNKEIQGNHHTKSTNTDSKKHVLVTHVLAKFRRGGSRIRQFQQKPLYKEATSWFNIYIYIYSASSWFCQCAACAVSNLYANINYEISPYL